MTGDPDRNLVVMIARAAVTAEIERLLMAVSRPGKSIYPAAARAMNEDRGLPRKQAPADR